MSMQKLVREVLDAAIAVIQGPIASIVGATRQWVTQSLDKLKGEGVLEITRTEIIVYQIDALQE
ncbi:helix-turn-helix domain-containing protein [Actibacterium sp. 188UL27-1]|uniref:helix-turn-helix domain-containing protein n=1 Tax=Actibacterium sp. 188UL27-1 TaxID=2786961 RepID=UPI00195CFDF2|nr:helix-turn-helix domain-containing protein [Actibacterium sp. 188UL27-1]MBM7067197.1 winged helix-turn-helix domain-containing protein [Actibacterium sp. 188UL27-1]